MEEFLAAIAASLPGSVLEGDTLVFGGCRFPAYRSYRRNTVELGGNSYRQIGRGRNRGYDVAAAVTDLIRDLPSCMDRAKRRATAEERKRVFTELVGNNAKRAGGCIQLNYYDTGYVVTVRGQDLAKLLVMCDYLEEMWL